MRTQDTSLSNKFNFQQVKHRQREHIRSRTVQSTVRSLNEVRSTLQLENGTSDMEALEQRGGSPLSREVGCESRTGRRRHGPSDPRTTPSDSDDRGSVGCGGRVRDTAAGGIGNGDTQRQSTDPHRPCSPPVAWQRPSTIDTTGARKRSTSGAGAPRPCRSGRDDAADGDGKNSTISI